MNTHIPSLVCTAVLTFGAFCFADTPVPDTELTPALGQVKNGGPGKYDFKRTKHDLRLENIVMNAEPDGDGSKITGEFTVSHLYLGVGGVPFHPADHLIVSFTAKDGKTESSVVKVKGENPWTFILTAGATAAGAPPQEAGTVTSAVTKIAAMTGGDAGPFMARAVVALTDRLGSLSKKKYQ